MLRVEEGWGVCVCVCGGGGGRVGGLMCMRASVRLRDACALPHASVCEGRAARGWREGKNFPHHPIEPLF
jgi:hypothetical protein